MARSNFGGSDTSALAILAPSGNSNAVKSAPNITGGTAWSAITGGTQYTDLVLPGGGGTTVRTDADGFVRAMQGPDGVNEGMWVDLGSGTRFYLRTTDSMSPAFTRGAKYLSRAAMDGLAPLKRHLTDAARSCAFQVLSDSTADGTTDWPYLFATGLGTTYPAWTVQWRVWNDTTQGYDPAVVIRTGTAGIQYLDCSTGSTTRRIDAAASPYLSGVIDVRMKLSVANWTPVAGKTFAGKSGADGVRGWYVGIQASTGRPNFTYCTDGLAGTLATRTVTVAPTVTGGSTTWIRWVFTPNNGAAGNDFAAYQSTDNAATWTQLGATVTTAGAVTVYNNTTQGYELGGVASGIGDATAKIYEVHFRDGLDGPTVAPVIPDLWPPYINTTAAPIVGAPTLTVVCGARSGATIGYLDDPTRRPKLTPHYGQLLTFLATSHNDGVTYGAAWWALYKAFASNVQARVTAPVVVTTENPQKGAAVNLEFHAQRCRDLITFAAQYGYGLADTFRLFTDYASYQSLWMADDVHPNAVGSQAIADALKDAITAAG